MGKILKTTLRVANFTSIPINIIGISVSRIQTALDFSLLFSKAVPSGTENRKKVFDALFLKKVILEIKYLIKQKHYTEDADNPLRINTNFYLCNLLYRKNLPHFNVF